MGRPRTFDEAAALDAAIDHFWRYGYAATSVRDLADHMRMSGASLYNAFSDKRTLFSLALQRYLDRSARRSIAELDASEDSLAALQKFFARLVESSIADRRGCMLVNSAMEVAPRDAELGMAIRAGLQDVEDGFRRAVEAAQRKGRALTDRDAKDLARLLLSAMIAIRVLARTTNDADLLRGIADSALVQLIPPKGSAVIA